MVFASVKRESHVYVSFNLKFICVLTHCWCRRQVRSCFSSLLRNPPRCPVKELFFFISPVVPQEWMLFQFLLKTLPTCTRAMKCVRAKFVVTGALTSTENFTSYGPHLLFSYSLARSLDPSPISPLCSIV